MRLSSLLREQFGNHLFATIFLLLSLRLMTSPGLEFLSLSIGTGYPTPRPLSADIWALENPAPASDMISGKLKFLCPSFLKCKMGK